MKYHYEQVVYNPGCSFMTEIGHASWEPSGINAHAECELTLAEGCPGQRFIGGNIEEFQSGDLVLIGPMLPHHYMNPLPPPGKSTRLTRLIVIKFPIDLGGGLFELPELESVRHLLKIATGGVYFSQETAMAVRKRMLRLFDLSGLAGLMQLLELLDELSRRPYRQLNQQVVIPEEFHSDLRLNRILELLHHNLNQGRALTLTEAAQAAHMTPPAFSKYFHERLGKSFIEYLLKIKIDRAATLLASGERTILEVAYSSGFNNLSNFNRHFRTFHGCTPSQFRKRLKGKLSSRN